MTDGREWLRRRYLTELADWLNPVALHYIFTRTPALDLNGKPIHDPDFEQLAAAMPTAAENIVTQEARAFFGALPERDRLRRESQSREREDRIAARKAGHAAATDYARRRQSRTPATSNLSILGL